MPPKLTPPTAGLGAGWWFARAHVSAQRGMERALGFARDYRAAGNRDAELAVVRKIPEVVPDSAAAQRYLAEAERK